MRYVGVITSTMYVPLLLCLVRIMVVGDTRFVFLTRFISGVYLRLAATSIRIMRCGGRPDVRLYAVSVSWYTPTRVMRV